MTAEFKGEERRKENISLPQSIIGVIIAIVFQTMGAVWWASSVTVKLDFLKQTQSDFSSAIIEGTRNRYTSEDAERDWKINERRLLAIEQDIKSLRDKFYNNGLKIKGE